MKRRDVIKMISIGMGYTLSATSLATLASSCKSEPAVSWTPSFFSTAQGKAIEEILEVMLPATDTPGAKDLNLAAFVDLIVNDCYEAEDKEIFRTGMNAFLAKIGDENALKNTSAEQATKVLEDHLTKAAPEEREKAMTLIEEELPPAAEADKDLYYRYSFLNNLRSLAIAGYFSSEEIATKHLNYLPVPGPYQGCIPVSEVGSTWALS